MINNVILVGRVVNEPELMVYESGVRGTKIYLSVLKPFRNDRNEAESDIIPIYVWYKTADVVCEYVGAGSIIGCKCRIGTHKFEVNDIKLTMVDIIAERISFIQTKPRTGKNSKDFEDLSIEKELQKGTLSNFDVDDIKDKASSVVFDDVSDDTIYDDSDEEEALKGKKKAKK